LEYSLSGKGHKPVGLFVVIDFVADDPCPSQDFFSCFCIQAGVYDRVPDLVMRDEPFQLLGLQGIS
jgi:hypothetical protein